MKVLLLPLPKFQVIWAWHVAPRNTYINIKQLCSVNSIFLKCSTCFYWCKLKSHFQHSFYREQTMKICHENICQGYNFTVYFANINNKVQNSLYWIRMPENADKKNSEWRHFLRNVHFGDIFKLILASAKIWGQKSCRI